MRGRRHRHSTLAMTMHGILDTTRVVSKHRTHIFIFCTLEAASATIMVPRHRLRSQYLKVFIQACWHLSMFTKASYLLINSKTELAKSKEEAVSCHLLTLLPGTGKAALILKTLVWRHTGTVQAAMMPMEGTGPLFQDYQGKRSTKTRWRIKRNLPNHLHNQDQGVGQVSARIGQTLSWKRA